MWTLSRLRRSQRLRRLLASPVRGIRSLVAGARRGLSAAPRLPDNLLGRARIDLENRRRHRSPPLDLVILDDCFPHLLSAFRIAEFNAYLGEFPSAEVHTTCVTRSVEGFSYRKVAAEYAAKYPAFARRVVQYDPRRILPARAAYVMFAHNAAFFLDTITRNRLPFAFTLYPGGGFQMNSPAGDASLTAIMRSPWFRKVIVTQRITRDYLLEHKFCRPDQIEFIFGGVAPFDQIIQAQRPRLQYRKSKATFDICFVANKYMPRGIDKGYDVFVEVAKSLARVADDIRFHVVGPFDGNDIDVGDVAGRMRFYGFQRTDFFPPFYAGMDVILSPNVPFVLGPGFFDGFPTGCCVEAGLCGVAVLCSDELKLNVAFNDGEEIAIIPRNVEAICGRVLGYYRDEAALAELSRNSRAAFRRVFDIANQMPPRTRLLREIMAACVIP
jgi:glycosyltransferase involved in cell wall biosynthesis